MIGMKKNSKIQVKIPTFDHATQFELTPQEDQKQFKVLLKHQNICQRFHGPEERKMQKQKGKQLFHDKERMYKAQLKMQTEIHSLKQQIVLLKVQLQKSQNEAIRYQEFIDFETESLNPKKFQDLENPLTISLRKYSKKIKNELSEAKQELSDIKFKMKNTKIEELELDVKVYETEAKKLKKLFERAIKFILINTQGVHSGRNRQIVNQHFGKAVNELLSIINQENRNTVTHIHEIEQRNQELEEKNLESSRMLNYQKDLLKELKSEMKMSKENRLLQGKLSCYDRTQQKKLEKEVATLSKQIEYKDEVIFTLKEKSQNLRQYIKELQDKFKYEKKQFEKDHLYYQNKYNIIRAKYDNVKNQKTDQHYHIEEIKQDSEIDKAKRAMEKLQEENPKGMKIKKVYQSDIKLIAQKLKWQLQSDGISLKKVAKILDYEGSLGFNEGNLSIQQMVNILSKKPFGLGHPHLDQALLFARYLIEDPAHPYLSLNLKTQQTVPIITSVLNTQLQHYKILKDESEQKMHDEVFYFFQMHGKQIREVAQTQNDPQVRKGKLTIQAMRTIFKAMGASFKEEFLQFIIIKLWEKRIQAADADQFKEEDIFEYFSQTFEDKNKDKKEAKRRR